MDKIIDAILEEIEYYKENPYEDGDKRYPIVLPSLKHVLLAEKLILALPEGTRMPSIEFICSGGISLNWYSKNWGEWELGTPNPRKLISVRFMKQSFYHKFCGIPYRKDYEDIITVQTLGQGIDFVSYPKTITEVISLIKADLLNSDFYYI